MHSLTLPSIPTSPLLDLSGYVLRMPYQAVFDVQWTNGRGRVMSLKAMHEAKNLGQTRPSRRRIGIGKVSIMVSGQYMYSQIVTVRIL